LVVVCDDKVTTDGRFGSWSVLLMLCGLMVWV